MSELLKVNVNDHTEKKNGLTYLSWAWAWAEVLKVDADASWDACEYLHGEHWHPCMFLPDGSAVVKVHVRIKDKSKSAVLPVMDHRNKAIKNPDAFAINTAIQRCLAKAIAMHGLGLYIYAGEDLPEGEEPAGDGAGSVAPAPVASIEPPKDRKGVAQDVLSTSPQLSATRKAKMQWLSTKVIEAFESYGAQAAFERIDQEDLNETERIFLDTFFASDMRAKVKAYSVEFHSKATT